MSLYKKIRVDLDLARRAHDSELILALYVIHLRCYLTFREDKNRSSATDEECIKIVQDYMDSISIKRVKAALGVYLGVDA